VTLTTHPPSTKKEYSYTSTPPMDRTACKEIQCLYKDALCFMCLRISNVPNNIFYSLCEPMPHLTMTDVDSRNM